jgi:sugar phosphate isomerase/epimerase
MNKNKIGVCEASLPIQGPYACKFISELGFDGMQLSSGEYERGFPLSEPFVQDAYMKMAEASGVEFPAVVAQLLDFHTMFPSKSEEESTIARIGIEKSVDCCAAMSIPILLVPNFAKSEIVGKQDFAEAAEVFKRTCDRAGKHSITIGMENTLSTEQTLDLISLINRPNLRIYFDTQNYYLHKGYSSARMLDELMNHVCQIHVKDGKGKDLSGALLGHGDADFHGCMEVVKRRGYDGWLVSENFYDRGTLRKQGMDAVALLKQDLKTIRNALA